jgi:hypothetical protein
MMELNRFDIAAHDRDSSIREMARAPNCGVHASLEFLRTPDRARLVSFRFKIVDISRAVPTVVVTDKILADKAAEKQRQFNARPMGAPPKL